MLCCAGKLRRFGSQALRLLPITCLVHLPGPQSTPLDSPPRTRPTQPCSARSHFAPSPGPCGGAGAGAAPAGGSQRGGSAPWHPEGHNPWEAAGTARREGVPCTGEGESTMKMGSNTAEAVGDELQHRAWAGAHPLNCSWAALHFLSDICKTPLAKAMLAQSRSILSLMSTFLPSTESCSSQTSPPMLHQPKPKGAGDTLTCRAPRSRGKASGAPAHSHYRPSRVDRHKACNHISFGF